jgi:hypothetical protein
MVMIDVHIQIGMCSYATFSMYPAWISPETQSTCRTGQNTF